MHSRHPGFTEGDFVHGTLGVQEFALSDGNGIYKVHPDEGRSLAAYLGVLGMTAYFGLLDVGRLAADDVVLVSGAAGAVGSVAGQIARIKGAHVIGIAGGPHKTRMLVDRLGFSAAIDYKRDDLPDQLRERTPPIRRRVLRQRRRRHPQPGTHPSRPRCASRDQRGDLPVRQRRHGRGTEQLNADVPELRAIYLDRADTHLTPIGVKGLREAVIVGVAPAIANAVFHATGLRIRELPITPQGPSLKQGRRRDLSHRGGGPSRRPAGAPSSDFAACVVCACIAGDVVLDLTRRCPMGSQLRRADVAESVASRRPRTGSRERRGPLRRWPACRGR
ncbi:zinc-binding dehydrogenase [Streptomyces sp. CA-142005]|uniref:zinc-binding dehydrogenase n=1 Tax=Streptomyces sp. CA-142005 TaxID=3240052 RepID=UPI003D934A40